ncbi:MAG TPA: hypothetical protein VIK64_17125 [Anaerolineales bacterium]
MPDSQPGSLPPDYPPTGGDKHPPADYGPPEGFESRSQRRLQDDLGVDEAATEAILVTS